MREYLQRKITQKIEEKEDRSYEFGASVDEFKVKIVEKEASHDFGPSVDEIKVSEIQLLESERKPDINEAIIRQVSQLSIQSKSPRKPDIHEAIGRAVSQLSIQSKSPKKLNMTPKLKHKRSRSQLHQKNRSLS